MKVIFMLPNVTPLLQPIDQGMTAAFKVCYLGGDHVTASNQGISLGVWDGLQCQEGHRLSKGIMRGGHSSFDEWCWWNVWLECM
jgi:hypothetical protein